ncbi:hypothetical protein JCM12294_24350 [Desulfocicer niacini]
MIIFCLCRKVTIVDLSNSVSKENSLGKKQAELLKKKKLTRKSCFSLLRDLMIEIIVKITSNFIF